MNRFIAGFAVLALISVMLVPMTTLAQEGPIGTSTSALSTEEDIGLWTSRNNIVPVCWIDSGFGREKDIVRAAIEGTWEFWSLIDFTGWGMCPSAGEEQLVRVHVVSQDDTNAGSGGSAVLGTAALSTAGEPAGVDLSFQPGKAVASRVEYVAVHEFGHVLGFGHEQDAPGNEGPAKCTSGVDTSSRSVPVTTYDRDSVMNYCNRDGNMTGNLTDFDIRGVQAIYGARRPAYASANTCQSAPLSGRASMAAAWNDRGSTSVAVFPSDGFQFLYASNRSIQDGGWGDTVKWMSGDFDGNGLTDLAAAWQNGDHTTLTLRLAQPDGTFLTHHWLEPAGGWMETTAYLPGDFNGDGLTDVAAVWNDGGMATVSVYPSDGTKFTGWTHWNQRDGGWGDTVKWSVGDFDADGTDDLLTAWNNEGRTTLTVRRSAGDHFEVAHWLDDAGRWTDGAVFLAGDFDGNGLDDVAQIWNDIGSNSIYVYGSTERGFGPAVVWANRDGGTPLDVKWSAGDFNGDGKDDLVAIWNNRETNTLTVRLSEGWRFVVQHWTQDNGGWIPTTAWCTGRYDL